MKPWHIQGRILNIDRFKIKKKIESCGLKWHEDRQGKIKIWIRLNHELEKSGGNMNSTAAVERTLEPPGKKSRILPFRPLCGNSWSLLKRNPLLEIPPTQ